MPRFGYTIDGNDLYSSYGVQVMRISGPLSFLNRKGATEFNWPDADGVEPFTDADDIYFAHRDFVLDCYIIADTRNQFYQRIDAFKLLLQSSGTRTLALPNISTTYEVYYVGGSDVNMVTGWPDVGAGVSHKHIGRFKVTLREKQALRTYY